MMRPLGIYAPSKNSRSGSSLWITLWKFVPSRFTSYTPQRWLSSAAVKSILSPSQCSIRSVTHDEFVGLKTVRLLISPRMFDSSAISASKPLRAAEPWFDQLFACVPSEGVHMLRAELPTRYLPTRIFASSSSGFESRISRFSSTALCCDGVSLLPTSCSSSLSFVP